MRRAVMFWVPLALLFAWPGLLVSEPRPKVSAGLRAKAAPGRTLRVLITLAAQPQREVLARIEHTNSRRLETAERAHRMQTALSGPFLQEARQNVDAILLETRQSAAREIVRLIEPEQQRLAARLQELKAERVRRFVAVNMLAATIPAAALAALESDPRVAAIDEETSGQGALDVSVPAIGAPALWSAGFTGAGGSIAIVDSGIRTDHPFFAGANFVNQVFLDSGKLYGCPAADASSPQDMVWHGTHNAAIAAGRGATGYPYFGVAKGIGTIYNVKVLCNRFNTSYAGVYSSTDVIAALDWLVANTPVKVINFSAGTSSGTENDLLDRVFDSLADTYGLFISVCAGNTGPSPGTVWSPGLAYNVVSVAAADDRGTIDRSDDGIAGFSSRGPTSGGRNKPDLAAPGVNISSANYSGTTLLSSRSGTSMAAPHVAGAAALLEQMGIHDALAQKAFLINSADAPDLRRGWRPDWGWGYVNLANAGQQPPPVGGTLPQSSYELFLGAPQGELRATLAWSRHILGVEERLSPLALSLYSRADGSLLAFSGAPAQNVQQIAASATGGVVLKIGGAAAEKFGLAVSEPSIVKASGPALAVTCTPPAQPAASASISVSCTATNSGDLEAFSVTGTMNPGALVQGFGTVPPGGSISQTWRVQAPALHGATGFQLSTSSSSFGQIFSATTSFWIAVEPPPAAVGGVADAAGAGTNLAPGILGSIYGTNLALGTEQASALPLPMTLGGASVTVNGMPVPLLYASPLQINFQLPYEVAPGQAALAVSVAGAAASTFQVRVAPAAPSIFQTPSLRAVVQNQDGSLNDVNHPAARGSYITAYFTGQGLLDNAVATGAPAPSLPLSRPVVSAAATIGGAEAYVWFIGLTPFFAGLAQANILVPGVPSAAGPVVELPLMLTIGGASSNGPLIAVQ